MIWAGTDSFDPLKHFCPDAHTLEDTSPSEWVRLAGGPANTFGIAAAKCMRCRIASVQAHGGLP